MTTSTKGVQSWAIKATSCPSADNRTSVCTLTPVKRNVTAIGAFDNEYWVDSPVATQLGLPLKICNMATEGRAIRADALHKNFRGGINNPDAVLNHVANRLFTEIDTTKAGFGELSFVDNWRFWDVVLIARTDGQHLDIEHLHAMDWFLRGRIKEIRAHTRTLAGAKEKQKYLHAIKDSSFTAGNMAATWESIKADGIAKGYEKYEGMGNPFKPVMKTKGKKNKIESAGGSGTPKICAYCGGRSFWLTASGGCEEVWYCGRACEDRDRAVHQDVCGGMVIDG
ncbi:hypothetical protein CLAFUW4_10040 [Fulvia fulva]|uniref:MYND-type domain-containing protein n=1 Tax=Passalora fulva TaxID=5499 RepID=A0A9Q8PHL4_PASFU|nr:uncharacterized protein CLAFUR5_12204 [Fulvia fulva]KAK4616116.1 hypothetical protein CLAFUR4_10044 [Fulvia fulva]KAK4616973.1 hypothetical protein CLAFUR0_10042 [Fulvia fulva]UJO22561.1 hypothetical protein CLAFUR5_12204 [Fulvia fulva]WPV18809.1 hypothetical protein CLAFUW4_10040 [Fulvia fulva]WPV34674.1 hypothetical protein CLAFUW7_10041 [Fulvia fulva]